ncbi:MAG: NTP transferase domain-containing protein [Patescibacteria group bacterium]
MRTVGLVIAKGHSRRLENKNFREFCGKPMFMWAVEKCLKVFNETYVSSDNEFVLEEAKKAGAVPIKRPIELCASDVMNVPVYQHAMPHMGNPDIMIAVKADSPTTDIEIVRRVKDWMERYGYDEIMTAYPVRGYADKSAVYGSVWAIRREKLETYEDPMMPEPKVLIVDPAVDIHNEEDLAAAETQMAEMSS